MAANFNPTALNAFRQMNMSYIDAGDNVKLQVTPTTESKIEIEGRKLGEDLYKGPLSAMTRSSDEKARNIYTRETLLVALAKTFDMEDECGWSNSNGSYTFSKRLMDKLESVLGEDFKRHDFCLSKEGCVTTGRPLTLRRVNAIVSKVDEACRGIRSELGSKLRDFAMSKNVDTNTFTQKQTIISTRDDGKAVHDIGPDVSNVKRTVNDFYLPLANKCMHYLDKVTEGGERILSYNSEKVVYVLRSPFEDSNGKKREIETKDFNAIGAFLNRACFQMNIDFSDPTALHRRPEELGAPSSRNAQYFNDYIEAQLQKFLEVFLEKAKLAHNGLNTNRDADIKNLEKALPSFEAKIQQMQADIVEIDDED